MFLFVERPKGFLGLNTLDLLTRLLPTLNFNNIKNTHSLTASHTPYAPSVPKEPVWAFEFYNAITHQLPGNYFIDPNYDPAPATMPLPTPKKKPGRPKKATTPSPDSSTSGSLTHDSPVGSSAPGSPVHDMGALDFFIRGDGKTRILFYLSSNISFTFLCYGI